MKKSNLITAEFLAMCAKVANQTDSNNHTGAKVTVAKYFKLKYFIRVFDFVEFMHNADGSLFEDLGSIRRRSGIAMMAYLKDELTEDQYNILDNSF